MCNSVLDKALKCFKETFLELLVRDITEWTSLSSGYVDQEMYYLGLQEFVYMLSMVMLKSFSICGTKCQQRLDKETLIGNTIATDMYAKFVLIVEAEDVF